MPPLRWIPIVCLSCALVASAADRSDHRPDSAAAKPPLRGPMVQGKVAHAARARADRARSHVDGRLLWEHRHDQSHFEQAFSAAALRGELFVAGFVATPSGRDFLLRVLDQKTGGLLAAGRYLGAVSYGDGSGDLGETLVSIHAMP